MLLKISHFFPVLPRFGRAATKTCRTVTEPSTTYPEQGMYDMEGGAFFRNGEASNRYRFYFFD